MGKILTYFWFKINLWKFPYQNDYGGSFIHQNLPLYSRSTTIVMIGS